MSERDKLGLGLGGRLYTALHILTPSSIGGYWIGMILKQLETINDACQDDDEEEEEEEKEKKGKSRVDYHLSGSFSQILSFKK